MLAPVDFDNDASRVTGKIDDVATNSNLTTEMSAGGMNSVAQLPPEFALGFRRGSAHCAREATLRRHD
jgi:hypothetical protein